MPNNADALSEFIAHFRRAISEEMDAMRERMGSFEVSLIEGQEIETKEGKDGFQYTYRISSADEKLVQGMECSLRTPGGDEYLVRVERLDGPTITISSGRDLNVGSGDATLVIYPWFLYEKLRAVIGEINGEHFCVERALTLFGKLRPASEYRKPLREHSALNESQRAAVQLCLNSDLAFVWGPPGTGKTTTLAHIVDELCAQGLRVLVLSTTNAAVDQALEKIAKEPAMAEAIYRGRVVRIGRSDAPMFGAGLRDVVSRLNTAHKEALEHLLVRRPELDLARRQCEDALKKLVDADVPFQQSLFGDLDQGRNAFPDLTGIFSPRRAAGLQDMRPGELAGLIRRRSQRLDRLRKLYAARISHLKETLLKKEQGVIDGSALVLSTLTNAYFSPLMVKQRFDVVIVEEASMAVLPTLFYAACLARRKTVMVGDPCQLPSIVQSDAPYVRRVMGRNIFEVSVPDPLKSPLVAMLKVQYRMHPVIGRLVSDSFYFGQLQHDSDTTRCEAVAGLEPYAGSPVVVLDTVGRTTCEQSPRGRSRVNAKTAEVSFDLAVHALESGVDSVAIITPYADQARAIRALLKEKSVDMARVECSTVHRFQGRECDVVILDTVDAEPMSPGVLLSERGAYSNAPNLVNVAISRARGKLIIIADVSYFKNRASQGTVTKVITRALAVGRRVILKTAASQKRKM